MARVHNFNAGPAAIPEPVLEKAKSELMEMAGTGMSIMEMSHRSKPFEDIIARAEAGIRRLLGVPADYAVLFLQGGASLQFAMLPMNLRRPGRSADYIDTGSWASKAIGEAKILGDVNVAWSGKKDSYSRVPNFDELSLKPDAEFVHLCSNETINGIQWPAFPKTETPLFADMSSDILSRPIDVRQFGLIYAGAQKNIGPSGMAVIIMQKELAERAPAEVPVILRYSTHIKDNSLYNTPNTWGVYMTLLTCEWLESLGGVAAIQKINEQKAAALYQTIDSSDFWRSPVRKEHRSGMNVVWRLPSEALEDAFVSKANKEGLVGLKGHRSVGGIRASIYNVITLQSVNALVAFMKEFEKKNG